MSNRKRQDSNDKAGNRALKVSTPKSAPPSPQRVLEVSKLEEMFSTYVYGRVARMKGV